jgi:hypothetical protein
MSSVRLRQRWCAVVAGTKRQSAHQWLALLLVGSSIVRYACRATVHRVYAVLFRRCEIEPLAADNDPRCGRACLFPRYAGSLVWFPIVGILSPLVGSKGS